MHIVAKLKDRKLDVGLIESPVMDGDLMYREWLEDELVVVSVMCLFLKHLKQKSCMITDGSVVKKHRIQERSFLKCLKSWVYLVRSFDVISEVSNTTAVLQAIKRSKKDVAKPAVSIISRHAIAEEVAKGELFESRLRGYTMKRKFYIVYTKENKHNAYVDNVVDYIMAGQC